MHTEIYTFFTQPVGQTLLYSAEDWVRAKFRLETAGPVAVSTREDVIPVLSGKGILLPPTGEDIEFVLPKGDRIFIAAEAVNRVKFIIEPIPWLEKISMQLARGFGALSSAVGSVTRSARSQAPKPQAEQEPVCPPFFKPPGSKY